MVSEMPLQRHLTIMPERISFSRTVSRTFPVMISGEGLTAIVSVKIENPQFEGQTKQKLGNSEARGAVDSVVSKQLEIFLEQNPAVAKATVEKSVLAQSQRGSQQRPEILQEENLHLTVCHFQESLPTCSGQESGEL